MQIKKAKIGWLLFCWNDLVVVRWYGGDWPQIIQRPRRESSMKKKSTMQKIGQSLSYPPTRSANSRADEGRPREWLACRLEQQQQQQQRHFGVFFDGALRKSNNKKGIVIIIIIRINNNNKKPNRRKKLTNGGSRTRNLARIMWKEFFEHRGNLCTR